MAAERPPRVLMTADTVGGVWTYAVELARQFDARGVQVAIATMGAPLALHQRQQLADTSSVTLFDSSYRLEWMQQPWDDVDAAGRWLLQIAREFQPDSGHLTPVAVGALAFEAPTLLVAHSCVLSWWRAVHGCAAPSEWDTYRERVARGLNGADLVAAPTHAMLDTLAENYGWRKQGLVLHNGASGSDFAPARKQEVILAAGRFWDAAKNLEALEQVAPDLPWTIKVAGNYKHPDGGTIVPVGVHCLGELLREQLGQELAAASIYALPARYEPFGLSVLEAALCGCALVLGDIPSLREVWGDAATYVPPNDHGALREALQGLIADAPRRTALAQAARMRAWSFTPASQCNATLAAYARLASAFAPETPEELACA